MILVWFLGWIPLQNVNLKDFFALFGCFYLYKLILNWSFWRRQRGYNRQKQMEIELRSLTCSQSSSEQLCNNSCACCFAFGVTRRLQRRPADYFRPVGTLAWRRPHETANERRSCDNTLFGLHSVLGLSTHSGSCWQLCHGCKTAQCARCCYICNGFFAARK